MKTNLVQNYQLQKPAQKKSFESADINSLPNRTYSEPLPPKGRLVRGNVLNSPTTLVSDMKYDARALKDGWKGKAKDHQLGKINDIGMKLGGLAIAAYLCTKKSTPSIKLMEFVGFGSFFASMALWPKIALAIPAKAIHGVDILKKYETKQNVYDEKSLTVKKPFYQDPQYIPWDLYKDEEIQKIGNRLGVDKNLPNRREFIQEKMKKIALQNNTMWMLTAGFATPIMSALICNQAEKYLVPFLDKRNTQKANDLLKPEKAEELAKRYNFDKQKTELKELLDLKIGEPIDKNLLRKITANLKADLDAKVAQGMLEDLSKKFLTKGAIIDDTAIDYLLNAIPAEYKQTPELKNVAAPTREQLVKFFEDRGRLNSSLNAEDMQTLPNELKKFLKGMVKEHFGEDKDALSNFTSRIFETSQKAFKVTPARDLTVADADELKALQEIIAKKSAKLNLFRDYSFRKVAESRETEIANFWNKVVKKIPQLFGITKKEMEHVRLDRLLVKELSEKKLVEIASSSEKTKSVMNYFVDVMAQLETKFPESAFNEFASKVDAGYDELGEILRSKGFKAAAANLVGKNGEAGSSKLTEKVFFKERFEGVKYSFYRVLETLDVYRRLATVEKNPHFMAMSKEGQQELIRLVKETTLSGHAANYSVKFTQKYPNDAKMFKQVCEFMFGNGGLSEELHSVFGSSPLRNKFTDYKVGMIQKVINVVNEFKPAHNLGSAVAATSGEKAALIGSAFDELMNKTVNEAFNTNKWLKTFGGLGIALVAVTVASQFLFGRLDPNAKSKEAKEAEGVKKG